MELKLKALYEPLTVEIGEVTVNTAIDVTADNLMNLTEVCEKASKEMDEVSGWQRQAEKERNVDLLRKANKKAAEILEPAIVCGIGQEAYDEIVKACGAGRKISKSACNIVMVRVLYAIVDTVNEHRGVIEAEKAAHYLAEADDAQPIFNAAI
ncbi:MAG: hypothetical protein IJ111_05770 [Eggerthellaceae bacterium]|nr:hypothetical protein [Eggerthellaceae bacterium]